MPLPAVKVYAVDAGDPVAAASSKLVKAISPYHSPQGTSTSSSVDRDTYREIGEFGSRAVE
jgi:hypothetical protein